MAPINPVRLIRRVIHRLISRFRPPRNPEKMPGLTETTHPDLPSLSPDLPSGIRPAPDRGAWVPTLEKRIDMLDMIQMLSKKDLEPGSKVEINTTNSTYELFVVAEDDYIVSGGWFDRQKLSPYHVRINGCTWGGSAIKHDIIAAEMMHIEFNTGNRHTVTTSIVRSWKIHEAS